MRVIKKLLKFEDLKVIVDKQLQEMTKKDWLFRTGIDKDKLWDTYLASFPEGTNPIFRERTEYDCQCCKQFIRACGNVVSIVDNKLVSIWDVEVGGQYQPVVDALSALVKSEHITDVFIHYEKNLGTDHSIQLFGDRSMLRWDHFYFNLPHRFVVNTVNIGTKLSTWRANKEVFKRSLDEITLESVDTVLELIEQGSLYRGDEHEPIIRFFKKHKEIYDKISDCEKDNYCWNISMNIGTGAKIKNTVIGTLLTDISDGMSLDKAVKGFETKVAPFNYKRPTALVTKGMIDKAEKKVAELGYSESLQRRYAIESDITVNNVLFADRKITKLKGSIFDELKNDVKDKKPNLNKVEDVDIKTFIDSILPKAESIELFLENTHINNLMNLVAPIDPESKHMFKWDNNFSWSYNGEVTDSIKERVKKAGGSVTGDLRCSLSWFNSDDLDIHILQPKGGHIYYGHKVSDKTGGTLDVDMNAGGVRSRTPVENITYAKKSKMVEGKYKVFVNQFNKRENIDLGFDFEIEFDNIIHSYHYDKAVIGDVVVAEFNYTHKDGIVFISTLPSTKESKEVWNLTTQKFHKVSMIMYSPNYWDDHKIGNKHWFFILDKCKNNYPARGFYNEFLNNELVEHRKVFELLGSKMKTANCDNQLSGIGFSSTQKNSILCRISGSFARTIKINF